MKGILRTVAFFFSCVPLQRWLTLIGLALVVCGHLRLIAMPAGDKSLVTAAFLLGLYLGLAFVIMPAALASGFIFRAISAPRTVRLIPYARLRLLSALLLSAVALAAFLTISIALSNYELPTTSWGSANPTDVFVGAFAVVTTVILYFFVGSHSLYGFVLLFVLISAPRLGAQLIRSSEILTVMSLTKLCALLVVGVWSAFALWYLRARRIAPPIWGDSFWASTGLGTRRVAHIAISRESATTVQLLGLTSVGRLAWRGFFVAIVMLLYLTLTLRRPDGRLALNAGAIFPLMAAMLTVFPAVVVAWAIARRSRTLWIHSGCTRDELFRQCERLSWRCFGATSAPVLAICVAAWILLPRMPSDWPYLLVGIVAPGICALYFGLMNVQGWRPFDVTVAVLIVVVGIGSVMVSIPSASPPLPTRMVILIALVELVGAFVLRSVAKRRWQRIDWLICKPQRMSSQALRPVV